jgi:two-component system response regulator YesN
MDERVRRTIELLEHLRYRRVPVARLAASVGLGASRLGHLFKRDTAQSIRAFVRARRLELAAELIASTDRRISEILYSVGFTDPANFGHAFKVVYGVSPRQYRAFVRRGREKSVTSPDFTAAGEQSLN